MVERDFYKRINHHIRRRNLTPDHQFGFRNNHTTAQQVLGLTEEITEKFNSS